MTLLVEPGTVVDTTTDSGMVPVEVTATLGVPVVGLPANPLHLDGPASWGAYLACDPDQLPPLSRAWALDFDLPLATWTAGPSADGVDGRLLAADGVSVWGWACSAATIGHARPTAVAVRRLPPTADYAHWTNAAKHHLGLGPRRAVNAIHQAQVASTVVWWALTPDPALLQATLDRVTHVGRVARHGNGRVQTWHVTENADATQRWQERAFPDPDPTAAPGTIRAPYWHPSRRMPVTIGYTNERPLWR